MNTIFGLLFLCVAPYFGAILGEMICKRRWLLNRWRVFLSSLPVLGVCAWLAVSHPWLALGLAVTGFCAIREGRAYPIAESYSGGYAAGPYGDYRPRVGDDATWGDVHHQDRSGRTLPFSRKSDLREMQEGAFGSIGTSFGKRFDRHPPVIHGRRPLHARLVVNNGHFPPRGSSAKRGKLRSVK